MADASYYLTLKALHIIAFTAWMAGLFYLPRLFVYHTRLRHDEPAYEMFSTMESKLLTVIMGPAAIVTWALGLLLAAHQFGVSWPAWLAVKLFAVALMSLFHLALLRHFHRFKAKQNHKPERHFRIINEAPTVLLAIIVFTVIFQPSIG